MNAMIQPQSFTPEETEARRRYIGGSDAAAAVNLNPYRAQFDLWQEKMGLVPPFAGNEATLWGKLHEPVVRQQYAERTGRAVRLPTETILHPKYPFMACHPDGLTDDRRLYEGKTARFADNFGEEGTDAVPEHYLIQCQHNMLVLDLPVTDLAVLIGGSELRFYEIPADRELQQMIVAAEASFWSYVERAEPPPVDVTRKDAIEVLRKLYPGTTGEIVKAESDAQLLRIELNSVSEAIKLATAKKDEYRASLLKIMGEATFLSFPDGKSYRRQMIERKAYSVEATSFMDFRLVKTPL